MLPTRGRPAGESPTYMPIAFVVGYSLLLLSAGVLLSLDPLPDRPSSSAHDPSNPEKDM